MTEVKKTKEAAKAPKVPAAAVFLQKVSPKASVSLRADPQAIESSTETLAKAQGKPLTKAQAKAQAKLLEGPLYKEKMRLDPEIEKLPFHQRPMIWRDLAEFAARHSRTIADMVYDMVLLTNHAYSTKTPLRTVVPFDLEFLTRLYDEYPSSCSWKRPNIQEMFDLMYRPYLKPFKNKQDGDVAQLAIGRRYARMLGRVDTAQYRWLSEGGKTTRRLGNILSKVQEAANSGHDPREVFEGMSKNIWRLRGFDVEKHFPMPDSQSVLKPPGTRGRMISPKTRKPKKTSYEGGAFA